MKRAMIACATLMASAAMAQPVQPPPRSYPVEQALAAAPGLAQLIEHLICKNRVFVNPLEMASAPV